MKAAIDPRVTNVAGQNEVPPQPSVTPRFASHSVFWQKKSEDVTSVKGAAPVHACAQTPVLPIKPAASAAILSVFFNDSP
jgi:hypothetical protein